MLLAKLATPEIQGQYFLAHAIAMPVTLLFGFELRGALVADAGGQFTVGTYRRLRQILLLPVGLILGAVALWHITGRDTRASFVLILAGVFAARMAWSLAEVDWGVFQRLERLDWLAGSMTLRGFSLLLPLAILLPVGRAWIAREQLPADRLADAAALGVLIHFMGMLAVSFLFDRPRAADPRRWDLTTNRRALWSLALQTLPLGLVAVSVNLSDTFPRWLFAPELATRFGLDAARDGKAQLGYFGSMAYITMAGNLIIIQASTAAANRLALYYQRDFTRFLRLGVALCLAALAVGGASLLVVWFAGEWILRLLYTPDHARFTTEFQLIVLAHSLTLLTNVFGATTTQMRLFWLQVPVQIVTLVVSIAAAVVLIPGPTPVRGAAYTALVRAAVQFVLYLACVTFGVVRRPQILGSSSRA